MLPTEQLSEECRRAVEKFTTALERNRHEDAVRRLQLYIGLAALAWTAHGVYLATLSQWIMVYVQLVGITLAALAWWYLKQAQNLRASVWALVWALSSSVAISAECGGRIESSGIWFVATPILVAVPFVDSRTLKKMSLVPGAFIIALLSLELFQVPHIANWYSESFFLFAQVQMVLLYAYLSYFSNKQSELELSALGDHRESSNAAARRAEQEDRKKTKFLAKMSHELRTPMNGLLGMVQYFETQGLSAESQSLLLRLRKRSEHILEHINDALDLTLVDAGRGEILDAKKKSPFDLNKLISGVCDVQTQFGSLSHRRLDVSLDIGAGTYAGDSRRLRHLLSTLLGTAFQDCVIGTVQLHVWQAPVAANDTRTEKELPVHFEIVYEIDQREQTTFAQSSLSQTRSLSQIESTKATSTSGVQERAAQLDWGAKYASVFRVAQLLGGSFEIKRESGSRMRATACIPLLQSKAPVRRRPSLDRIEPLGLETTKRHALVVDDNAINRKVAVLLLKKLGCTSDTANDGVEAVTMARSNRYDVIFMDLRMPNMDGFEATQEIVEQRDPGEVGCPIIALTANAFDEDIRKAREVGMVEHLAKPVTLAKLSEALENYVSTTPRELERSKATGSEG